MKRPLGTLRIIGGEHRSRIVEFDAADGVRPTPDRVRQTLFDWLSPIIEGAHCVDLFAGSGALGLEALSRGAAHVILVDSGRPQAAAIRAAVEKLRLADRASLVNSDALAWLRSAPAQSCDIAFLDPPYGSRLLPPALEALPRLLKPHARVYLEWPRGKPPALPPGYELVREKQAGQVSYGLASFTGVSA